MDFALEKPRHAQARTTDKRCYNGEVRRFLIGWGSRKHMLRELYSSFEIDWTCCQDFDETRDLER